MYTICYTICNVMQYVLLCRQPAPPTPRGSVAGYMGQADARVNILGRDGAGLLGARLAAKAAAREAALTAGLISPVPVTPPTMEHLHPAPVDAPIQAIGARVVRPRTQYVSMRDKYGEMHRHRAKGPVPVHGMTYVIHYEFEYIYIYVCIYINI